MLFIDIYNLSEHLQPYEGRGEPLIETNRVAPISHTASSFFLSSPLSPGYP